MLRSMLAEQYQLVALLMADCLKANPP